MTARDDRGSITPLIVGFVLLVAVLVAVVVDASAAYLRRQGLNSLADAAALAATDGLQGEQVYTSGLGEQATIDPASATRHVGDYLSSSGALAQYPGLSWQVRTNRTTVTVTVSTPLELPLRVPGVATSTTVRGVASSVVMVSP